jgi:hypothetical protein
MINKKNEYFLIRYLVRPFLFSSIFLLFFALAGIYNCYTEEVKPNIQKTIPQKITVESEEELKQKEIEKLEKDRLEKEENEKLAKKLEKDSIEYKKRFKKINKNNCKLLSNFQSEVPKELESISDEINSEFWNCIENKMIKYVTKRYPFTKDFIKNEMLFPDGSSTDKKFYDFFATSLMRNPITHVKVDEDGITARKVSNSRFQLIINPPNGKTHVVNFQYNTGKLVVVDFAPMTDYARSVWPTLFTEFILNPLTKYPNEYEGGDHWDWDMLDAIK